MRITETADGNITIFSLNGRLDGATSSVFETKVNDALQNGSLRMVIDCAQLEYVSSAGLRVFLHLAKSLKTNGGKLELASLYGPVREVFDIAGFTNLFPIHPTQAAAVQALR